MNNQKEPTNSAHFEFDKNLNHPWMVNERERQNTLKNIDWKVEDNSIDELTERDDLKTEFTNEIPKPGDVICSDGKFAGMVRSIDEPAIIKLHWTNRPWFKILQMGLDIALIISLLFILLGLGS